MEKEQINDIAEQELKKLEFRINELIHTCERLKEENRLLRERQGDLNDERMNLIKQNEVARTKVENIIARLRALEETA
ncbi:MAG: TIGR02449 family protein [Gammaproteobacteria bacterium]|jgi:cell division protein ZapB|nr:TIGR02449 family protein [Gammaproteobacteria bacterium]